MHSWMYDADHSPDFDEMMDEVRRWSDQNNVFPIRRAVIRNLLLMGKTRTGKTTVAKVLQDPCYVPPDAKLHSETRRVTVHPVAISSIQTHAICCINVIDTPVMFDKMKSQNKCLKNEQIKRTIDKCIQEDVTNIHLFAFVISLQGNVDSEDIASMIFVRENYPFLHDHACLLVTHCEEADFHQREAKISEFFQLEKVMKHNLKDLFGNRIFFMGSLRPQLMAHPNKQSVRQQIKNVHQMRDELICFLFQLDSSYYFNIHDVAISNPCHIL